MDGRISHSDDLSEPEFDRSFEYDFVGRLTQAKTGTEANGGTTPDGPFKQTMAYDAMNEMTSRTGRHWTRSLRAFSATYVNGRNTDPLWQYDAAGNITQDGNVDGIRTYTYDAAGRQIQSYDPPREQQPAVIVTQSYDGNGSRVENQQSGYPNPYLKYEIRSSALGGQVVAEINSAGQKTRTNVYAWGEMIAYQYQNQVFRVHYSPIGSTVFEGVGVGAREVELDTMRNNVGVENPYQGGGGGSSGGGYPSYGDGGDTMRCSVDGDLIPCKMIMSRSHFEILSLIVRTRFRGNLPFTDSVTIEGEAAPEQPTYFGDPTASEESGEQPQVYINAGVTLTIETVSYIAFGGVLPTVGYLRITRSDSQDPKVPVLPVQKYNECAKLLGKSP